MKKRSLVVAIAIALLPSGVSAQQRAPEVDVLSSAVDAISRMHMVEFSDSVLWMAAIDGVRQAYERGGAEAIDFSPRASADWEDLLSGTVRSVAQADEEIPSDSLLWEAAIDGLIDALNDPYAELFTPQESDAWEEETTGNYSGIGLQITLLNDEITVTAVFRGFPASQHGIAVGDVIVGVNEHDATDWGTDMAADSIRGPVDTDVEVRIKRPGYNDPVAYNITRAQVHVPAVSWGVLDGDIGYVVMDRVARNAAREMSEALAELEDHRGLIIDLRRNPGGFLDESLMLADLFLEPGSTLASTEQRVPGRSSATEAETQSFSDRWPQMVPDLPLVILVDEFTASGAEILAGALQDYDRAVIIGERSFGKGVVQTVMQLPHGRRLRFTTGTWLTPLGRSLQRPRDSRGRPLEVNLDALPRVTTGAGRALIDGGGIFPDLVLEDDTLTIPEQELIRYANENQFPLALRLTEFGFKIATARRESEQAPGLSDEEFDAFVAELVAEGLPREFLEDEIVRDYLRWRSKLTIAQRMDDIAAEAIFRTERDPVLSRAIELVAGARSQSDLFSAVAAPMPLGGR